MTKDQAMSKRKLGSICPDCGRGVGFCIDPDVSPCPCNAMEKKAATAKRLESLREEILQETSNDAVACISMNVSDALFLLEEASRNQC